MVVDRANSASADLIHDLEIYCFGIKDGLCCCL